MKKKKILHIIGKAGYNGAAIISYRIIDSLQKFDHYIFAINKNNNIKEIKEKYTIKNVGFVIKNPFGKILANIKLRKYIISLKPNIIHYHDGGIIYLLGATLFSKQKVIHHIHCGNIVCNNSPQISLSKYLLLKYLQRKTTIVFSSYHVKFFYFKYFGNPPKSVVIQNSIDKKFQANKIKQKIKIGYLGRITNDKNISLLKSLCENKLLNEKGCELIIKGDIEEKIIKYQLSKFDNITIEKGSLNINDFFMKINLLVFPSLLFESCPNVVIESVINNIPVVAFKIPAITEILGQDYPLVVNDFSNNSLIEVIIKFTNKQYNQESLSSIHKEIASKFSYEKFIKLFIKLYSQN